MINYKPRDYFIYQFTNKKIKLEDQWAESVLLTCHYVLWKLYTEPSIGASYQISINLAIWFWEEFLKGPTQTRTSYGSHISCMIGMKCGNPIKKQFIVAPSFRGEDFLNFSLSYTRITHDDNVFCLIRMKWANLIEDLP